MKGAPLPDLGALAARLDHGLAFISANDKAK